MDIEFFHLDMNLYNENLQEGLIRIWRIVETIRKWKWVFGEKKPELKTYIIEILMDY